MAEMNIYGEIGEGLPGSPGITAESFSHELQQFRDDESLSLYISSPGGVVRDGLTIYSDLTRRSGEVTAHVHGIVGSIASIILMAADKIKVAQSAQIMIHDPLGPGAIVYGHADELREAAAENEKMAAILDGIRDSMADVYADRTRTDRETIVEMMANETWMSANDALDLGFADEVIENKKIAALNRSTPFAAALTSADELADVAKLAASLPRSSRHQQTISRLSRAKAKLRLLTIRD